MDTLPKKWVRDIVTKTKKQSFSSVGRALALHARCRRFDSYRDYNFGDVAQLVEHLAEDQGVVSSILTVTTLRHPPVII